jgi:1-acyl-sn-glycerol-3-phosphate acyltransferase
MSYLRATLRFPTVLLLTIGGFGTLLAIAPLRHLSHARHLRLRNGAFRIWAQLMARVMGMRMTVRGTPPAGAFFLVANHISYMDIVLLSAHVHAGFVAKADLRAWPVFGTAFGTADTIFVDRNRRRDVVRVMRDIEDNFARELGVILFPEGTSGKGDCVLPFKASILELPVRIGKPVRFATIHYQTDADQPPPPDVVCWWGDAPLRPHLWRLLRMRGFDATLTFGPEAIRAEDRKLLASRLHASVAAQFEPMA